MDEEWCKLQVKIYGQIKLAKEIPLIDELYLWNGKSVEQEKFILTRKM